MGAYENLVLVLAFVATMTYQAAAAEVCAGCPLQQDPAKFPMGKLSQALATAQVNDGALKILSVTVQVVAGIKYTVSYESFSGKTCTASWVDAPWVNHEPLDTQISCRAKRSLGDFEDVDESEFPDLENFGNQAVNTESNGYRKVVMKVLQAQKQLKAHVPVAYSPGYRGYHWYPKDFDLETLIQSNLYIVAANSGICMQNRITSEVAEEGRCLSFQVGHGLVYQAKFLVKSTSCQMEQVPEYTCMEKETAPREVCTASLFASPYLTHGSPHLEVMNLECSNSLNENFLAAPAGSLISGHDEKDLVAAESFAVHMINAQVNSLNYKGLYKVLNVEEKMQAGGHVYTFELELRDTDCTKENGLISNKACNFVGNTADLKCTTKVWYWPWSGLTTIVSNKCSQ